MGVDDGYYGFLGPVLIVEVERHFRGLHGNQGIKDGDAVLSLDDRHIRQILVADLVDPRRDLEEARYVDQLRLTPQTRVHGVGSRGALLDEVVLHGIPDGVARLSLDHRLWQRRDETLVGKCECGLVRKGKFSEQLGVRRLGGVGRVLRTLLRLGRGNN